MTERDELERRVLLLAPTAMDAEVSGGVLREAGMALWACQDLDDLCRKLAEGAGVVIVPEEAVLHGRGRALARRLAEQPPWSAVPTVVLTARGSAGAIKVRALMELGDVTLLGRPLDVLIFVNAVAAALRDRERQYRIRDQLAELESARTALMTADRRKDEFLALLAHELRGPLAPIRNGLQILRIAPDDAEATALARGMMDRQMGHLVRLIDDLVDVSRLNGGLMELRLGPVRLSEALARAVELARPLILASGHAFEAEVAEEAVLDADMERLVQVFGDLLTNSAKYTAPGGRIRLEARPEGDFVRVSVADNGAGIPAKSLGLIFDMFSQVDRRLERETGGLGIGLSLVRGLVEMHGGTVEAASEGPGKGSTFTVRLPRCGLAAPGRSA